MKKVRVTLELDESFVRLLQHSVQMKGWLAEPPPELDPVGALSIAVLGEARGAKPRQIAAKVACFQPSLTVVHDERRVILT